jgi:hypothetical protein
VLCIELIKVKYSKLCAKNVIKDNIQGVSRLVDITAGGDFLDLCDQKVHINMCSILDGYGVMTA